VVGVHGELDNCHWVTKVRPGSGIEWVHNNITWGIPVEYVNPELDPAVEYYDNGQKL
jgi:hypothetical protein